MAVPRAGRGRPPAARPDRAADRGLRPDRDQRGVRRPDPRRRPRARLRLGQGQRQRRRDRARPPDRRQRRADRRDAPPRAGPARGRYGLATLCLGGGGSVAMASSASSGPVLVAAPRAAAPTLQPCGTNPSRPSPSRQTPPATAAARSPRRGPARRAASGRVRTPRAAHRPCRRFDMRIGECGGRHRLGRAGLTAVRVPGVCPQRARAACPRSHPMTEVAADPTTFQLFIAGEWVERRHRRDVREPQPGRHARRRRALPGGHAGGRGDGDQGRRDGARRCGSATPAPKRGEILYASARSWPSTRSASPGR